MRVTVAKLKRLNACSEQVRLFAELFPDGVDVTEALCVAHADKFDWDWAARHLLPAPLLVDYKAKRAPLWADYLAEDEALWADYVTKCAALFGRLAEQVK